MKDKLILAVVFITMCLWICGAIYVRGADIKAEEASQAMVVISNGTMD